MLGKARADGALKGHETVLSPLFTEVSPFLPTSLWPCQRPQLRWTPWGWPGRCLCFLMVTGVRGEGEGVPLCCFSSCVPSSSSVTLPFLLFPPASLSFPMHALLCLFLSPLRNLPLPLLPLLPPPPRPCPVLLVSGCRFPLLSLSLICPLLLLPPPLPSFSLPYS